MVRHLENGKSVLLRQEFETLEQNGITRVALPRIGDPDVIPLWFGEGDLVTPDFIRNAAKQAIDDGLTFYNHPSGRADLLAAIKAYLDRIYDIDLDPDRIAVPGSTMLGIFLAARMAVGSGDHALIVSPNWPNIDRAFQMTGAEFAFVRQRLGPDGWTLDLEDVFAAARPEHARALHQHALQPDGLGHAGGRTAAPARLLPRARHRHPRGRGLSPQHIRRRTRRPPSCRLRLPTTR